MRKGIKSLQRTEFTPQFLNIMSNTKANGFFILILCALFSFPLSAQDSSEQYKRYFILSSASLSKEDVKEIRSSTERNEYLKIERFCAEENVLLVSARADYPKRVGEIQEEILSFFPNNDNKINIQLIQADDLEKYCN